MKKQILFVDDDISILRLLKIALRDYDDIDVITETNSISALKALESITPDLIILDIVLPEINGYELCQKIRSNERFYITPIIAFTSIDILEIKEKLIEAGFNYVFLKSMNFIDFINNVISLIKE